MNKNIEDYLAVYRGVVPADVCNAVIKDIDDNYWWRHQFYDPMTDTRWRGEFECEIQYSNGELETQLMQDVWNSYYRYISELGFGWYIGWTGFSPIRFNRYKETTEMQQHCDHIQSVFDGERKGIPTLSCLGILNDDYVGGELVFWEDKVIDVKQGDILVFPSNFLYPHMVKPVKEGIRYSFVSWAW